MALAEGSVRESGPVSGAGFYNRTVGRLMLRCHYVWCHFERLVLPPKRCKFAPREFAAAVCRQMCCIKVQRFPRLPSQIAG
jgi:hypothetical protein